MNTAHPLVLFLDALRPHEVAERGRAADDKNCIQRAEIVEHADGEILAYDGERHGKRAVEDIGDHHDGILSDVRQGEDEKKHDQQQKGNTGDEPGEKTVQRAVFLPFVDVDIVPCLRDVAALDVVRILLLFFLFPLRAGGKEHDGGVQRDVQDEQHHLQPGNLDERDRRGGHHRQDEIGKIKETLF